MIYSQFVLWVFLLGLTTVKGKKCNGNEQYCDLKINQYTFAGAHNGGSRLSDSLWYKHSGVRATKCFYSNQDYDFLGLLDRGIRFLDVDTCINWDTLSSCHGNVWTGDLKPALSLLKLWMSINPNEVVMIHFNWDVEAEKKEEIGKEIQKSIEGLFVNWHMYDSFAPIYGGSAAKVSDFFNSNGRTWPTLGDAIDTGKRLFVLMDNGIAQHIGYPNWAHVTSVSGSNNKYYLYRPTLKLSDSFHADSCSPVVDRAEENCKESRIELSDVAVFAGWGLCIWDMSWRCSEFLTDAVDACYADRAKLGKTVNVITADYATKGGRQNVPAEAERINAKNVAAFL